MKHSVLFHNIPSDEIYVDFNTATLNRTSLISIVFLKEIGAINLGIQDCTRHS